MHEIGLERKRDGAYAWGVFEDTAGQRPDRRDLPHSVAARTQASAHAGDDRRPHDRGPGAHVPEGAAEGDVSRRAQAQPLEAAEGFERLARRGTSSGPPRSGRADRRSVRRRRLRRAARSDSAIGFAIRRTTSSSVATRRKRSKRADAPERVVEIGAGGRAGPEVVAAPYDRFAPQVQEGRAARRVVRPNPDSAGRNSFQNCSGSIG